MHSSPILPRLYAGTIEPEDFSHRDHLQAGWECFRLGSADQPRRLAAGLRALAARAGAPDRYHATVTGAFLALIGSAMKPGQPFESFLIDNPGLMNRRCLLSYYSPERLELQEARSRFLMPDRQPLPHCPVPLCGVEPAADDPADTASG